MKLSDIFGVAPGCGGFQDLLGIEDADFDENGRLFVELKIEPQHMNVYGKVHGGTIAALCDVALGCYCAYYKKLPSVALNSEIHYYRPGEAGSVLRAIVNERKVGRRISTFLVEVMDDRSRHIADCMFTSFGED